MSVSLPYGLRRCPTLPPHPPPEHQGEPSGLCVRRHAGSLFAHCEPTFSAGREQSDDGEVSRSERSDRSCPSRATLFNGQPFSNCFLIWRFKETECWSGNLTTFTWPQVCEQ